MKWRNSKDRESTTSQQPNEQVDDLEEAVIEEVFDDPNSQQEIESVLTYGNRVHPCSMVSPSSLVMPCDVGLAEAREESVLAAVSSSCDIELTQSLC